MITGQLKTESKIKTIQRKWISGEVVDSKRYGISNDEIRRDIYTRLY